MTCIFGVLSIINCLFITTKFDGQQQSYHWIWGTLHQGTGVHPSGHEPRLRCFVAAVISAAWYVLRFTDQLRCTKTMANLKPALQTQVLN